MTSIFFDLVLDADADAEAGERAGGSNVLLLPPVALSVTPLMLSSLVSIEVLRFLLLL